MAGFFVASPLSELVGRRETFFYRACGERERSSLFLREYSTDNIFWAFVHNDSYAVCLASMIGKIIHRIKVIVTTYRDQIPFTTGANRFLPASSSPSPITFF